MMIKIFGNLKPIIISKIIVLLSLLMLIGLSANAEELKILEKFSGGIAMANSVGMAMAGDEYNNPGYTITYKQQPNASKFLKFNSAHLVKVNLFDYSPQLITGMFTYENDLGRAAYYGYTIKYKEMGELAYHIKSISILSYEPMLPRIEAYFIPSDQLLLKKMRTMQVADLLRYAREHTEKVVPDAPAGVIKDYDVLAFSMDRFLSGAKWSVHSNGQKGVSWSKGGWHVARIKATFALNSDDLVGFQVFHTIGKDKLYSGKTVLAGTFYNHHIPQIPLGPVDKAIPSLEIKKILDQYYAIAQPSI